jgi:hypothetical protein
MNFTARRVDRIIELLHRSTLDDWEHNEAELLWSLRTGGPEAGDA